MDWSPEQRAALALARAWLAEGSPRGVFRLFGFAGTGKTTLARELAAGAGDVRFGAFTGKAASVLRRKGCPGATTLHRLIYTPKSKSMQHLKELQEELAETTEERSRDQLEDEIRDERANLKRPSFSLNLESSLVNADLLIIDEVSMIDKQMGEDVLQFGVPVLVLGDPAQLPPVMGGGFFTTAEPDVLLKQIHRQAAESPVLHLATMVREGTRPPVGDYGSSKVVARGALKMEEVMAYDQVIVGTNDSRRKINQRFRARLGRTSPLPEPGDRVICLRNDHDAGLLNGSQYVVRAAEDMIGTDRLQLFLEDADEDSDDMPVVEAHKHYFEGRENELAPWDIRDAQCFDYAYAMTAHKAQGSEWSRVVVLDESRVFRGDARRWLYTAITRASDAVTVVCA